ncbi:hypothetical protein ABT215_38790 [Streptomyces sp900105755]|uniref:OTU domain-containing protein n=1 Tax=Streptomyces sp. 900105755 TaxID=3154389 RepID=UPI00331F2215
MTTLADTITKAADNAHLRYGETISHAIDDVAAHIREHGLTHSPALYKTLTRLARLAEHTLDNQRHTNTIARRTAELLLTGQPIHMHGGARTKRAERLRQTVGPSAALPQDTRYEQDHESNASTPMNRDDDGSDDSYVPSDVGDGATQIDSAEAGGLFVDDDADSVGNDFNDENPFGDDADEEDLLDGSDGGGDGVDDFLAEDPFGDGADGDEDFPTDDLFGDGEGDGVDDFLAEDPFGDGADGDEDFPTDDLFGDGEGDGVDDFLAEDPFGDGADGDEDFPTDHLFGDGEGDGVDDSTPQTTVVSLPNPSGPSALNLPNSSGPPAALPGPAPHAALPHLPNPAPMPGPVPAAVIHGSSQTAVAQLGPLAHAVWASDNVDMGFISRGAAGRARLNPLVSQEIDHLYGVIEQNPEATTGGVFDYIEHTYAKRLTPDEIRILRQRYHMEIRSRIPLDLNTDIYMLAARQYAARNGGSIRSVTFTHVEPNVHGHDVPLGKWLAGIREQKIHVSPQESAELTQLGMRPKATRLRRRPTVTPFRLHLIAAHQIYVREGTLANVRQDHVEEVSGERVPVGDWFSVIRARGRTSEIPRRQAVLDHLDSMGFRWETIVGRRLKAARQIHAREGTLANVRHDHVEEVSGERVLVGHWFSAIRARGRTSEIPRRQAVLDHLDSMGFRWETMLGRRLKAARQIHAREGTLANVRRDHVEMVSDERVPVGSWFSRIRTYGRVSESPRRQAVLDQLDSWGFRWETWWETPVRRLLQAARQIHAREGTLANVRHDHVEEVSGERVPVGGWLIAIRARGRTSKTPRRQAVLDQLDSMGFRWDRRETDSDLVVAAAREYVRTTGLSLAQISGNYILRLHGRDFRLGRILSEIAANKRAISEEAHKTLTELGMRKKNQVVEGRMKAPPFSDEDFIAAVDEFYKRPPGERGPVTGSTYANIVPPGGGRKVVPFGERLRKAVQAANKAADGKASVPEGVYNLLRINNYPHIERLKPGPARTGVASVTGAKIAAVHTMDVIMKAARQFAKDFGSLANLRNEESVEVDGIDVPLANALAAIRRGNRRISREQLAELYQLGMGHKKSTGRHSSLSDEDLFKALAEYYKVPARRGKPLESGAKATIVTAEGKRRSIPILARLRVTLSSAKATGSPAKIAKPVYDILKANQFPDIDKLTPRAAAAPRRKPKPAATVGSGRSGSAGEAGGGGGVARSMPERTAGSRAMPDDDGVVSSSVLVQLESEHAPQYWRVDERADGTRRWWRPGSNRSIKKLPRGAKEVRQTGAPPVVDDAVRRAALDAEMGRGPEFQVPRPPRQAAPGSAAPANAVLSSVVLVLVRLKGGQERQYWRVDHHADGTVTWRRPGSNKALKALPKNATLLDQTAPADRGGGRTAPEEDRVQRDGNCFYRAVSILLGEGDSDKAVRDLRQAVVEWLDRDEGRHMREMATAVDDLDALRQTVATFGAWTGGEGDLAVYTMANALRATLLIHRGTNTNVITPLTQTRDGHPLPPPTRTLHLHLHDNHYTLTDPNPPLHTPTNQPTDTDRHQGTDQPMDTDRQAADEPFDEATGDRIPTSANQDEPNGFLDLILLDPSTAWTDLMNTAASGDLGTNLSAPPPAVAGRGSIPAAQAPAETTLPSSWLDLLHPTLDLSLLMNTGNPLPVDPQTAALMQTPPVGTAAPDPAHPTADGIPGDIGSLADHLPQYMTDNFDPRMLVSPHPLGSTAGMDIDTPAFMDAETLPAPANQPQDQDTLPDPSSMWNSLDPYIYQARLPSIEGPLQQALEEALKKSPRDEREITVLKKALNRARHTPRTGPLTTVPPDHPLPGFDTTFHTTHNPPKGTDKTADPTHDRTHTPATNHDRSTAASSTNNTTHTPEDISTTHLRTSNRDQQEAPGDPLHGTVAKKVDAAPSTPPTGATGVVPPRSWPDPDPHLLADSADPLPLDPHEAAFIRSLMDGAWEPDTADPVADGTPDDAWSVPDPLPEYMNDIFGARMLDSSAFQTSPLDTTPGMQTDAQLQTQTQAQPPADTGTGPTPTAPAPHGQKQPDTTTRWEFLKNPRVFQAPTPALVTQIEQALQHAHASTARNQGQINALEKALRLARRHPTSENTTPHTPADGGLPGFDTTFRAPRECKSNGGSDDHGRDVK